MFTKHATIGALAIVLGALLAPNRAFGQCEVGQLAKLTAPGGGSGDQFGRSVALSGDVLLVGAPYADTAVGGTGAAYIYRYDSDTSGWVEERKLTAPDGATGDWFGISVDIDGIVAIIGAPGDDDACAGDTACNSGAVYVFRFDAGATEWGLEQKLVASDAAAGHSFGLSLSVSGGEAVVGAPRDDDGEHPGSVYVLEYDGTAWVEVQKLTAPDAAPGDMFGGAVSIDGDVLVVGAPGDDYPRVIDPGSAYIYRRAGDSWLLEQKLTADDCNFEDKFGGSVSVGGNVVLIGAHHDDDRGFASGSAYVFRHNGRTWLQEQKLVASDGTHRDAFGFSVSIDHGVAVVGARAADARRTESGAGYLFRYTGSRWLEVQKLAADDGASHDLFGSSIALGSDMVVIGAPGDYRSGSVYEFALGGDCNANGVADACDVDQGQSPDCNDNHIPDECEPDEDCDGNDLQDICDIAATAVDDCNHNGIPDQCEPDEDCNGNGVQDICDIAGGISLDCQPNGFPDECDIAGASSEDVDLDGVPDECMHDVCLEAGCRSRSCIAIKAVAVNGHPITPTSEVTIEAGDTVQTEFFVSSWAEELPLGVNVYNITVNGQFSATSGPAGTVLPVGWDIPFGERLHCDTDEDCPPGLTCFNLYRVCSGPDHDPDLGAYVDSERDDFILSEFGGGGDVWTELLDWYTFFGLISGVGIMDPGYPMYAGTLLLTASEDACGTFFYMLKTHGQDLVLAATHQTPSLVIQADPHPLIIDVAGCDCNENGVLDHEEITAGSAVDCNGNGRPDECEPDCNANGIADECDITDGRSRDFNGNGVPDECQPIPTVSEWGLLILALLLLVSAKVYFGRCRPQVGRPS